MPTSYGEPLTKLRAVKIRENSEPLVDPRTLSKRVYFAEKHPKFEDMKCSPKVRKRVTEMLAKAADHLPPGIDLKIIEGFRPLAQQRVMYEFITHHYATLHPEWNKSTLTRMSNQMSAPPDDPCPPPHSTGGAVDVFLFDVATGEPLDMVSPYEWDETSAETAKRGLSLVATANRRVLIETLEAVELTNYTGEWWHWSYGDSGWALRVGAEFALYDRLPGA